MSIDTGGRRYLAWLGTESGYQPLRADLGTLSGYTVVSRHRRRETVQITLGPGLEARSQFLAALTDRGLDYRTVTEIPFEIELVGSGSTGGMFYGCELLTQVPAMDTSQSTNMAEMFQGCKSLTSVPVMDTSQVTNMAAMFFECRSLTHVPEMNTGNVTNMNSMFANCLALTHVPDMDTSQATNMAAMFYGCTSLTDGNVRLTGRHPDADTAYMITGSGLTREPFYDADDSPGSEVVQIVLGTGYEARDQLRAALADRGLNYQTVEELPFDIELVGAGSTQEMFFGCSSLTSVPEMDTSGAVVMSLMFFNCESLTSVPDLDTSSAMELTFMFYGCASLTDGNVRLIGRHPDALTTLMIADSGLTREPFYDADGNPI